MSSQLYGQPGPSHRISHPERTGCGGLSSSLQLKIPTNIRQSITIQRIFFIFSSIWVDVKGYSSLKTGIWYGFKISKYHIQIKVLLGGTHQLNAPLPVAVGTNLSTAISCIFCANRGVLANLLI